MKTLFDYKTILWDFDGVLLNSESLRNRGFREVLKPYPDSEVAELLAYHKVNGGLSRYVKFRYFFEHIRGESVSKTHVNDLAGQFSRLMLKWLINPDLLIRDSLHFIKTHSRVQTYHIVSGSDEKELNHLCQSLAIGPYFKSIKGSPTPKTELVKQLMNQYAYTPSETCLIGDSINDYQAAQDNEIPFFGYRNPDLKKQTENYIEHFS